VTTSSDAPFHWEPYPEPPHLPLPKEDVKPPASTQEYNPNQPDWRLQLPVTNNLLGQMCPDGGTCHHNCADSCFRVGSCGPLSGVFPNDDWPADVVRNPAPVCLPFLPPPLPQAWPATLPLAPEVSIGDLPNIPPPPLPPPPLYVINTPYPEPPTYVWDIATKQWIKHHPLPLHGLTPRKAPVLNRNNRGPYSLHDDDHEWDSSVNSAEACPVDEANILTSEVAGKPGMHKVALDIDLPAKLLPSSTPGHWHLYIDRELPWETYTKVLDALAEAGIIETGYARASKIRGYTSVRPPWLPKTEDERSNGGTSG
jgi:hypothetical protein